MDRLRAGRDADPRQRTLRPTIEWAIDSGRAAFGLEITIALSNFWVTNGPSEGMRLFDRLIEAAGELDPALRARALRDYAGNAFIAGQRDLAERLYNESLDLFRALGDERNIGVLLHRLAVDALVREDLERARTLLAESMEIALAVGNRWGECQVIGALAHIARAEGDSTAPHCSPKALRPRPSSI